MPIKQWNIWLFKEDKKDMFLDPTCDAMHILSNPRALKGFDYLFRSSFQ